MAHYGRNISELIDASAEIEELALPSGNFVATISKGNKIALAAAIIVGIIMSIIFGSFEGGTPMCIITIILSAICILFLPTYLSYKGYISRETIREEYFIVFFKVIKEVEWTNIKYKKIKRNEYNEAESIKFYDENMKRLMSFDKATVGFTRIVKMAKKGSIKEVK